MTFPSRTAESYRAFAAEARGRSPRYEELALAVAGDARVLGFLAALPTAKRQPNLLFAAARYLLGEPPDLAALHVLLRDREDELAGTMLGRRTQTNEPARCATLLPALALLPQPLAIVEVGASAGLTLLADKYSYDYDGHEVAGTDPRAPVLACQPRGPVPLPARVPEIAWRAGLDLNPLDVTSDDDVRWLQCLVWPGETGRQERLSAAIETARRDPPPLYRGDLLTDLPDLISRAPRDATVVVYHSAVLAYVRRADRARFARTVRELGAVWLSNEGPGVLPGADARVRHAHGFILVKDGTEPIAVTESHGRWLEWLASSRAAPPAAPAGSSRSSHARASGPASAASAGRTRGQVRPAGQTLDRRAPPSPRLSSPEAYACSRRPAMMSAASSRRGSSSPTSLSRSSDRTWYSRTSCGFSSCASFAGINSGMLIGPASRNQDPPVPLTLHHPL